MNILGLLLIIYFIKEQFHFGAVSRVKYWIIPVVSFVMFWVQFVKVDVLEALFPVFICVVVGLFVGWLQTYHLQVKQTDSGLFVRSGFSYLLGWLIVFIMQVVMVILVEGKLKESVSGMLIEEVKRDVFTFLSFTPRENVTGWLDWLLIGVTGLAYFYFSRCKYPEIGKALKKTGKKH
ncbi:hypothetical protein [Listeria sp. PSOL-1]|uniref:hypothetical protein n=1 Tax=Listeria sp. PSOL-1 TaxID=1844999 RepID=UPI0013D139F7|nr:hypothetical protein [Listeria sp. PSOL-1]